MTSAKVYMDHIVLAVYADYLAGLKKIKDDFGDVQLHGHEQPLSGEIARLELHVASLMENAGIPPVKHEPRTAEETQQETVISPAARPA